MSLKVSLKLAALLTALTFTIVAIFWLKQGHMGSFLTSLGFQSGDRINWCSERVKSIYHFESGAKLLEKEGKWIWRYKDKSEKELDYLRVEKWFARFCQVPFTEAPNTEAEDWVEATPLFEVEFLGSQRTTISDLHYTDHAFLIGKREFQSETLRKGFKELLDFGEENQ